MRGHWLARSWHAVPLQKDRWVPTPQGKRKASELVLLGTEAAGLHDSGRGGACGWRASQGHR